MFNLTQFSVAIQKARNNPEWMLLVMAAAMAISLNGWMALINNFTLEEIDFTGREIGILQGIREIPGFMAFGVIYVILFIREQRVTILSLILLGVGTALTGFFPALAPVYLLTFIASLGFHYYETINQSLTLQLVSKERAPEVIGRQVSVKAAATVAIYIVIIVTTNPAMIIDALVWIKQFFGINSQLSFEFEMSGLAYKWVFLIAGGATLLMAILAWLIFPAFKMPHEQRKQLILRKRYWLFYALTFMSGARRQIFMVFAAFMMVEKFGYSASDVTLLFLINQLVNIKVAPIVGRLISKWGERNALIFEYVGLIFVFTSYAFVEHAGVAAGLYVIDHLFFAFAIAINTYFHKIADPKDLASTAGVSFTINHIAAVGIPPIFGLIWLVSPSAVFLMGSAMAFVSLILSLLVPFDPREGQETTFLPFRLKQFIRPAN